MTACSPTPSLTPIGTVRTARTTPEDDHWGPVTSVIKGLHLHVQGLDAIDGTPVLDIKPYLTEMNPPAAEIREPAWVHEVMKSYW